MLVSFREGIPQISDHLFQVNANMKQMKQFTTYRHPKTRQATWSHTAANKRVINLLPLPMVLHTICANDDSWELHGRMASWEWDTCNRYKYMCFIYVFMKIKKSYTTYLNEKNMLVVYTCFYVLLNVKLYIQHMRKDKLKSFLFQQDTLLLHFLLAVLDKPNIPNVSENPGNLHISPSTAVLVISQNVGWYIVIITCMLLRSLQKDTTQRSMVNYPGRSTQTLELVNLGYAF